MSQPRSQAERRRFMATLKSLPSEERYELMRKESTEELCALVGVACGDIQRQLIREIRNTDDL